MLHPRGMTLGVPLGAGLLRVLAEDLQARFVGLVGYGRSTHCHFNRCGGTCAHMRRKF